MAEHVDLSHLNRRQRRQLRKKLRQKGKDVKSLADWLAEPGKTVTRAEIWNLLPRFYAIMKLQERYNSPLARLQRAARRLAPWMDDPPPSPFEDSPYPMPGEAGG